MDWIAMLHSLDWAVLEGISALHCGFLDTVMPLVTSLGNAGWFWILLTVICLCLKDFRRCGIAMAAALVLCLLIGNVLLKPLVARVRPFIEDPSISLLIQAPHDFSFPSGHSMTSFAPAVVLFAYHRRVGLCALVLSALIAFSRLYLFVHYPTDVLAGSLLGVGIGCLSVWLVRHIRRA